jgi:hypothetical protein
MPTPRLSRSPGVLAPAILIIAGLTALACRPRSGPDRFLGEFRWRQMFGYQAIRFEENGKASYTFVTAAEEAGAPPETEVLSSTYRVSGDTAFMVVDWPDARGRGDTLALQLRGDTLVLLNEVLGGNPVFLRLD